MDIQKHLNEVTSILQNRESEYYDKETGDKIVNIDENKRWFSNNIMLVFATGRIFDKNDKELLDEIMTYFDNNNSQYLSCYFVNYSYTTEMIKKLESLQSVANGNYHIILFIINYSNEKERNQYPEIMFAKYGICECLTEISEIRDEMIRLLTTYGYVKEVKFIPTVESNPHEERFKIDNEFTEINDNSIQDVEMFKQRTKISSNVNGLRTYPKNRRKQYKQNDEDIIDYHINSETKGVFSVPKFRTDDIQRKQKEEDKNVIIFDTGNKEDVNSLISKRDTM